MKAPNVKDRMEHAAMYLFNTLIRKEGQWDTVAGGDGGAGDAHGWTRAHDGMVERRVGGCGARARGVGRRLPHLGAFIRQQP